MEGGFTLKLKYRLISGFLIITMVLTGVGIISISLGEDMEQDRQDLRQANQELEHINTLVQGIYKDFHLISWYCSISDTYLEEEVRLQREAASQDNMDLIKELELDHKDDSRFPIQFTAIILFMEDLDTRWENILNDQDPDARSDQLMRIDRLVENIIIGDTENDDSGLDYIHSQIKTDVDKTYNDMDKAQKYNHFVIIIGILFATILSISMGMAITYSISRPVSKITDFTDKVSRGDTKVMSESISSSITEMNELSGSFHRMANSYFMLIEMVNSMQGLEESMIKEENSGDSAVGGTASENENRFGGSGPGNINKEGTVEKEKPGGNEVGSSEAP